MQTLREKLDRLGIVAEGQVPNYRQLEWFRREKNIFFHFGINTFTGREWGDGTEDPAIFDPKALDCRQWVRIIKEAGFKSAILTAKHHDGFCLWPTKYTEHSVKNSPYKGGRGDIVREFTDACREFDIKAGIYLSPWDRHEPTWGTDAYNDFYANQLTELMTNYGTIYECWWDGAGSTEASYDWDRWASIVRTLQPNAVIFGSLGASHHVDVRWIGNEKGVAGRPCYATVDVSVLQVEDTKKLNTGSRDGDSFIPGEADVSIRPGWFYHEEQDAMVRTPDNLLNLWFSSIGRGTGLLLNLPPNKDGLISEADERALLEFSKKLDATFSADIVERAHISASSALSPETEASFLTDGRSDSFFAPAYDDAAPNVTFEFEKEEKINTVVISELIELGHRAESFTVSALVLGEWKTLARGECIGYKFAERFDTVSTKAIKLTLEKGEKLPLISGFELYFAEYSKNEEKRERRDLMKLDSVAVTHGENEIDVNLGGIFPYDTIRLSGEGVLECKIYIFNGTTFELRAVLENDGRSPIEFHTGVPIDYSYRFKIELTKLMGEYGGRDSIEVL